jgi:cell division protease FtsH
MMGMGMGGFMGGGSGALTRLLYEMDGIEDVPRWQKFIGRIYKLFGKELPPRKWHVLFMGSTNRPDVLDPALLRPGRFDQKIQVDAPDKAGRREIVKGYLSRVKYDGTVNVEAIVEDTPHATPAQIASALTKDAVRIALFNGRGAIAQKDIDLALQEQRMGIEQPIEEWDAEQRTQVAYHEAGHAVAQHYLMPEQRIVRLSIIRRGGALGYMLPVDRVEVYAAPLRRYAADIMVAMAGHVATKIFMGEYWTGAWSDFSMVRRNIWSLYSLGYFGPPVRGIENGSGGGIPANADPLIERFWKVLEEQTEQVLRQHGEEVEALTRALLENSDLSHDEVMALLGDNGYRQDEPKPFHTPRANLRLPPAPVGLPAPGAAAADSAPAEDSDPDLPAAPDFSGGRPPARMVPPPRPSGLARPRGGEAPEPGEKPKRAAPRRPASGPKSKK